MNLIPEVPGLTPSYWCTWATQGYATTNRPSSIDILAGLDNLQAADNLNQELVFGANGWAGSYGDDKRTSFLASVRADLYLLFDLGWDIPLGIDTLNDRWKLGSVEINLERFPSCNAATPAQRLERLNTITRAAGWRGAGLWIGANAYGEGKDGLWLDVKSVEFENYWRERLRWCHSAGIQYWKVDFGNRGDDLAFRQALTQLAQQEAPDLWVEHAVNIGPLNDIAAPYGFSDNYEQESGSNKYRRWGAGRVFNRAVELLQSSSVFRTYDVTGHLSTASTLDRVVSLLKAATNLVNPFDAKTRIINCEDEVYLGAVLGCSLGVMRHPSWKEFENKNHDPHNVRQKIDEVIRAVRWQRIAPAIGVAQVEVQTDETDLTDSWLFQPGDTWAEWVIGREIKQTAPAIVARNIRKLPLVQIDSIAPFVIASRHPNGAVALATLPRTLSGKKIETPAAVISLQIQDTTKPIGIFGYYQTLHLELPKSFNFYQVWAQDLAADEAFNCTHEVEYNQATNTLSLSGSLINRIGRAAATPNDLSEPGLVLRLI